MTKIEWAEESWNPVSGCTPVSPGCAECYAKSMAVRLAGRYGYPPKPDQFKVTLHKDKLDQPLKWRKPRRVFVCSMGDLFHEDVSVGFLTHVFDVIAECPQHTFIILTKRPDRMKEFLCGCFFGNWRYKKPDEILPNVWLGVSCEKQRYFEERVLRLLQIPAAVRFVSLEPLLGPIDFRIHYTENVQAELDWVIVGAESKGGRPGRPCEPRWVNDIVNQCERSSVPVFVKQVHKRPHQSGEVTLLKEPSFLPQQYPERHNVPE